MLNLEWRAAGVHYIFVYLQAIEWASLGELVVCLLACQPDTTRTYAYKLVCKCIAIVHINSL